MTGAGSDTARLAPHHGWVKAELYSLLGTSVAVIVHHLAFDSSYGFVHADAAINPESGWTSSAHAGLSVVAAHVVLTALCAVLLHGVDATRRRVLYAAGRGWKAMRAVLRRLFVPACTPLDLTAVGATWRACPRPGRAPPVRTLLVATVIRRGPPPHRPLAV
ncbi:hypothetical protein OG453_31935 [Streptomyces sp. NBC_01381]|uniref:hypothetical protein n=1 Tax=Streptomyces sp. NBC_01381 TaxID=2903845 RepID=UPI0022554D63|nr:hypothetical protein [Streptomyces sp. NBC_01381]MCX4671240.1 hypothetical protein [Streptomyces sp. NBC_01381]